MTIAGHGIDIVGIHEFRELLEATNSDFATRCFTVQELSYAHTNHDPAVHLAGFFACKEAAAKAMGWGFSDGVAPNLIEVGHTNTGRPVLSLSGAAATRANQLEIRSWSLSISHTSDMAVASAIALR